MSNPSDTRQPEPEVTELDFTAASDADYIYDRGITPGGPTTWYPAVVKGVSLKPAKNGRPMLTLAFGVDGDQGGVRINFRIMDPLAASTFRTMAFRGLGYENVNNGLAPDGTKNKKFRFNPKELTGLECLVRIKMEEQPAQPDGYGGVTEKKWRPQIADIRPVKGPNEPVRRAPPADEIDADVPFGVPGE